MCDGVTIFSEYLNNGIYVVSRSSIMYTSSKCSRIEDVSDAYLWHCRLGHVNKNRINKLIQGRILEISDYELLPTCESYLLEKMTKSPFKEKGDRASDIIGLDILMYVDL